MATTNGQPVNTPYFRLRGAAEGFYGAYYTHLQRNELIRFLGQHGFNFYLYAPKNDRSHRVRWREPYPETVMGNFAHTIALARSVGVRFCYSVSPAETIRFTGETDFATLTARLRAFYKLGVRTFGLLFDDIMPVLRHETDRARFATPAHAHAALANRVYAWLQALDPDCTLLCCPVEYAGIAPFPGGLHLLAEALHPAIDLFYTGPAICTPTITVADVTDFTATTGRVPILWDNYPVNDLAMTAELHLGPLQGREATLSQVTKGYLANLMLQPAASQIPLLTVAEYLANPYHYDPAAAWERALQSIGGAENVDALRLFAENSLFSVLDRSPPEPLARLADEALAALQRGETATGSAAVHALDDYLSRVDEACYHLNYLMPDLALRHDLLPWLELLDYWQDMSRHALAALRAREQGHARERSLRIAREWRQLVARHPRQITGDVLLPLVDYVLALMAKPTAQLVAKGSGPMSMQTTLEQ